MKNSPLALCLYCKLPNLSSLDGFCCEGCRFLFEMIQTKTDYHNGTSRADQHLAEYFGRKIGSLIHFECYIDPLVCEACMQSLAQLPNLVPGLLNVGWNRQSSVLSFQFPENAISPSHVFHVLDRLKLAPRWKRKEEKATNNNSSSKALLRIGVTGAIAGNMMLFSIPIYGGLTGSLQIFFESLQFILFLPVLLWSAVPFYKTALSSWRLRQLSLDLPLTVAFLAGSGFSIASFLQGQHDLYFDSLTGFLFLILTSRYLLESALSKYLKDPSLDQFFAKPLFEVQRKTENKSLPWSEIQKGDVIHLRQKDRVPVDGTLTSPQAYFELAWMTGETTPYLRLYGSHITAGAILLSDEAFIETSSPSLQTKFAKLLETLRDSPQKLQSSVEAKIGTLLILLCALSVAALFIWGSALGLSEIFRRSVSLFIVACPCAISFAAPLARAKASRLAFKNGFWIRDPDVWTKLLKVKKIAFDKTGTLVTGNFVMSHHSPLLDTHWKK
ncbi:MAG: HAD-IC family P-type ATPase, partial [Pseudobdellovibrionaceae bacterium]